MSLNLQHDQINKAPWLRRSSRTLCTVLSLTAAVLGGCGHPGQHIEGSDPQHLGEHARALVDSQGLYDVGCGEGETSFVSVWRTTSPDETITLPLREGFAYDFQVDWGDGSPPSWVGAFDDAAREHRYAEAGDYKIVIRGIMETIYFNGGGDREKIIAIPQLGDVGWKSFEDAFHGCSQLGEVSGGDTSGVLNMRAMFGRATKVEPDTSGWDTSQVRNMGAMFYSTERANPDVSGWDTSSVTNMSYMFKNAKAADPDVAAWETGKVTDMRSMFDHATAAEQFNPGMCNWDTSNASTGNMFVGLELEQETIDFLLGGCVESPEPFISTWRTTRDNEEVTIPLRAGLEYDFTVDWGDGTPQVHVDSVDDEDLSHAYATAGDHEITIRGHMQTIYFNANEDREKIISIRNLGDMGWLTFEKSFYGCSELGEVSGGVTSGVVNMRSMFGYARKVMPDTSGWDTSSVRNMGGMFAKAAEANPDVSGWDTSKVTNMSYMFMQTRKADPDLSGWIAPLVGDMRSMFDDASGVGEDVLDWYATQCELERTSC